MPLYFVYFTSLPSVCVFSLLFFNIDDEVNVTNSLLRFANDASLKSKALLRIIQMKTLLSSLNGHRSIKQRNINRCKLSSSSYNTVES